MAFLVKDLFSWNECSKNTDIIILSNYLVNYFLRLRNFSKYYLHAKFKTSWIIQTEITGGGGGGGQNLPSTCHTNLQKARPVYD